MSGIGKQVPWLADELTRLERDFLRAQNERLRKQLREQWWFNHAEHCGKDWPHEGWCGWERPSELQVPGFHGVLNNLLMGATQKR